MCFHLIANGAGGGYRFADTTARLLVIADLRHLPREAIATGILRFPPPKASTITTIMAQKTKLNSIFRLSSEQLETRVNLSATTHGMDRHLDVDVPAPHVAQVKVAPHSYSVVMPQVKAAVAKTVTIPTVGRSGNFQWNWQADRTLRVQLGNLRGTFTSVNQDGWRGEFSYKAKLAGGTSLTHSFNMSFSHDRDAEESTLTYDDAKNRLSTTFDEAAAVSTTASGTSIQRPNGKVETSSVSGSTVVGTSGAKAWQESSTADGSTRVTSTKPQTLGTTLDEVKALMTGLKASLDKSFRTVRPTVYRASVPGVQQIYPITIPPAVGWNAMQAVQAPEVKAGSSTALGTRFANQVQAMGTATRPQASLTITSFPYSYTFNKSQAGNQDGVILNVYYNGQLINSFTQASGDGGLSYSGDNAPNMEGTQGQIVIYNASQIGTYVFNCNGSSSTQLTIHVTS